jgi:hypothetical protein
LDRERSYSLGTEVSTLVREKKDSYTYDGECSLIFDGVQERDGDLDRASARESPVPSKREREAVGEELSYVVDLERRTAYEKPGVHQFQRELSLSSPTFDRQRISAGWEFIVLNGNTKRVGSSCKLKPEGDPRSEGELHNQGPSRNHEAILERAYCALRE